MSTNKSAQQLLCPLATCSVCLQVTSNFYCTRLPLICTPTHHHHLTCVPTPLPPHLCTHTPPPAHIPKQVYTGSHTSTYLHTPLHTSTHLCTPPHTSPHTPALYLQDPAVCHDLHPPNFPCSHLVGCCRGNTPLWDLPCSCWRPCHHHSSVHPSPALPPRAEVEVHCDMAKAVSPGNPRVWNCCHWHCNRRQSLSGNWASWG